ncbi:MAG: hypothetical protein K0S41_4241, partial [Anaerocolumna sp.]|nr:hypothetical protein [Anaerocolumna sp.]
MKITEKIKCLRNKLSLKTQLTTLVIVTVSVIIITIISYNYRSNIKTIMLQQIAINTTLLELETQNLDAYLSEIGRYSLLIRNDEKIMLNFKRRNDLSYSDIVELQSQIKSNFYSRNDLLSYRLYLSNHPENFEISRTKQRVGIFYNDTIELMHEYKLFTIGKYYNYIKPTKEKTTFLVYYRTIINIENKDPLAIVELTFDTSYIDSIAKNHDDTGEILCMLDSGGRLFYSNREDVFTDEITRQLNNRINTENQNSFTVEFNGTKYLCIYNKSLKQNYSILILNPLSKIDYQVIKTRNISLLLGFIAISISALVSIIFIDLVTKPLSKLSHRLKKVGKGNFTSTTNISGSKEITQLADNFNDMIQEINDLITKNYLSEINEKTARLIALEAQLNPHFLYNTLQAISAEAIVNKQPQINSMVTALASMLRYTIKGGDMVKLEQEMKHVKDYLLLQHARFGESLTYEINMDPNSMDILIPKISIQLLVENAIVHGMGSEKT